MCARDIEAIFGGGTSSFGYTTLKEYKDMCNSNNLVAPFPAKQGEQWFIRGEAFTVDGSGYRYFDTNGNPDAKYVTMRGQDGTPYVITEKAFLEKAKREEPLVIKYISTNDLLNAEPCEEGVREIARITGAGVRPSLFGTLRVLAQSSDLGNKYPTQWWYDRYTSYRSARPADSWLLFVAKALNLVPKTSTGPDRKTLLRLLGIKEV